MNNPPTFHLLFWSLFHPPIINMTKQPRSTDTNTGTASLSDAWPTGPKHSNVEAKIPNLVTTGGRIRAVAVTLSFMYLQNYKKNKKNMLLKLFTFLGLFSGLKLAKSVLIKLSFHKNLKYKTHTLSSQQYFRFLKN